MCEIKRETYLQVTLCLLQQQPEVQESSIRLTCVLLTAVTAAVTANIGLHQLLLAYSQSVLIYVVMLWGLAVLGQQVVIEAGRGSRRGFIVCSAAALEHA